MVSPVKPTLMVNSDCNSQTLKIVFFSATVSQTLKFVSYVIFKVNLWRFIGITLVGLVKWHLVNITWEFQLEIAITEHGHDLQLRIQLHAALLHIMMQKMSKVYSTCNTIVLQQTSPNIMSGNKRKNNNNNNNKNPSKDHQISHKSLASTSTPIKWEKIISWYMYFCNKFKYQQVKHFTCHNSTVYSKVI